MSNSQSAHDVSACDDDDGYGEIGVYARRTGTVMATGQIYLRKLSFCACSVLLPHQYMHVANTCMLRTHFSLYNMCEENGIFYAFSRLH